MDIKHRRLSCINNVGTWVIDVGRRSYINNVNTQTLGIDMPEINKNNFNYVIDCVVEINNL